MSRFAAPLALSLLAAACTDGADVAVPAPVTMTDDAVGHYCQMIVLEHAGPKAQVHLAGIEAPLWFSQVRDAFVFDRLPEETAAVAAIYVNDMGVAESWEEPGVDNWIAATDALYVIGSSRRGGMGAPEFVPFSDRRAAESFAREFGGTVIAYADITDAMVLAPVEVDPDAAEHHQSEAGADR